jgi:hypothetical protein
MVSDARKLPSSTGDFQERDKVQQVGGASDELAAEELRHAAPAEIDDTSWCFIVVSAMSLH